MSGETFEPMENFLKKWMDEQDERRRKMSSRVRAILIPHLKQQGVFKVILDYDGYGDSTSDDSLTFYDEFDDKVQAKLPVDFDESEVMTALYAYVPDGYENNEGGYGQVILDVASGKIRNEHSQRYVETTYSEQEHNL